MSSAVGNLIGGGGGGSAPAPAAPPVAPVGPASDVALRKQRDGQRAVGAGLAGPMAGNLGGGNTRASKYLLGS